MALPEFVPGQEALAADMNALSVGAQTALDRNPPAGGAAAQVLAKLTPTDYDYDWADVPSDLPAGGAAAQVLAKLSATDDDVGWVDQTGGGGGGDLPPGGDTDQVLTKLSPADDDVGWVDLPAGGDGALPGDIKATVQATAPTGWLMLDGSTIIDGETIHVALWAVIPASWKSGANIVLPDARGRALIGAGTGSGLTARELGAVIAGEEAHLLTSSESGLVAHNHVQNGHSHGNIVGWDPGTEQLPFWDGNSARAGYGQTSNTAGSTPTNIAVDPADALTAHNNMQPSIAFNLMVKATGGGGGGGGLPPGGATGQVLAKLSATDDDVGWVDQSGAATPWIPAPLENGWVNYANGWVEAAYRKVGDIVQIRGLVKDGVTTATYPFFWLPAGYQPAARQMFNTVSDGVMARFDIGVSGEVVVGDTGVASATWFLLECSFSTV